MACPIIFYAISSIMLTYYCNFSAVLVYFFVIVFFMLSRNIFIVAFYIISTDRD